MISASAFEDFKSLHADLVSQVLGRHWAMAGGAAVECQRFIHEALGQGQEGVAEEARELLDQILPPLANEESLGSGELAEMWPGPELMAFIFSHVDLKPTSVLLQSSHLAQSNAQMVIDGVIRRGVLERPKQDNLSTKSRLQSGSTVQLIHALLDKGLNKPAATLIMALPHAEGLDSSDFFVDEHFTNTLLRLAKTEVNVKSVLGAITEPLCELTGLMRNVSKGKKSLFTAPPLLDLYALAHLGAIPLARRLFITGDYISRPVVLSEVASQLGGPFTRSELIEMGSYRINFEDDASAWFSNALYYWLDDPQMPWPFFNKLDEGDYARQRLSKKILAYSRNQRLGIECHAHALAHTFRCRPFKDDYEREHLMRRAAVLYVEGYTGGEHETLCMSVMRDNLPRTLQVAVFPDKDTEMAIDLGL